MAEMRIFGYSINTPVILIGTLVSILFIVGILYALQDVPIVRRTVCWLLASINPVAGALTKCKAIPI